MVHVTNLLVGEWLSGNREVAGSHLIGAISVASSTFTQLSVDPAECHYTGAMVTLVEVIVSYSNFIGIESYMLLNTISTIIVDYIYLFTFRIPTPIYLYAIYYYSVWEITMVSEIIATFNLFISFPCLLCAFIVNT